MQDTEISTPEQLEATLAGRAMRRQEKLWKAAEGRTFVLGDVIGAVLGAATFLAGFARMQQEGDAILLLMLGLGLMASTMFRRQQAQISALRQLLARTRYEPFDHRV